ncbi:MAG: helix-turn-helix domain-containing protein [Oscillospiraceae bacterium]|nr:helix-turn-helix domain-containing protein [Oscillospiraceae bacterium]
MQSYDIIKPGLDYIEQNLKADITAEELACMAGYSVWHYHRLFAQTIGMPIAAYIGKQRLDKALSEIAGGRRAIDAAMDYGFDTYAGFYKAFVRVYGGSPKKYLQKMEVVMATEKKLQKILVNWDMPSDLPIMDIYIMDGAKISGDVWSVGRDYILKTGERESFLKNIMISKALAEQGFAASVPVLTKSGGEYAENLTGKKIYVLTKGIKGGSLPKQDRFGENRRDFGVKYGKSIARLHNALAAVQKNVKVHEQNLYSHVTEWALPEVRKQNDKHNIGLPDGFFTDYIEKSGVLFEKMPKQLIHRDPNPSNILFDGNEVSGFINFDISQRNVRLWDPCYCATGILSEWRGVNELFPKSSPNIYEKWPDILEGVLQGYNSVNPLTAEEKQAVYYVTCSIQMIFVAYCEPKPELKALAETNREMLKFIVENKARIKWGD